jgi:FkbM family methyltransferase
MLIPVKHLANIFKVKPKAILHVGAHEAEELEEYDHYFNVPVVWVDAQLPLTLKLGKRFEKTHHKVIHAAAWDKPDVTLEFNLTNNSQSSSVLKFGTHKKKNPKIKVTETLKITSSLLEDILPVEFNPDFINIDIQGAELNALKGMGKKMSGVRWIYCEVNKEEVYEGCALVKNLDEFLGSHGFVRVSTRWSLGQGWGDALYIHTDVVSTSRFARVKLFLLSARWYLVEGVKYVIKGLFRRLKIV